MEHEDRPTKHKKTGDMSYKPFLNPPLKIPRNYITRCKAKSVYVKHLEEIDNYNKTNLDRILVHKKGSIGFWWTEVLYWFKI